MPMSRKRGRDKGQMSGCLPLIGQQLCAFLDGILLLLLKIVYVKKKTLSQLKKSIAFPGKRGGGG